MFLLFRSSNQESEKLYSNKFHHKVKLINQMLIIQYPEKNFKNLMHKDHKFKVMNFYKNHHHNSLISLLIKGDRNKMNSMN